MKYAEKVDVPATIATQVLDRSGWLRRQAVNERAKVTGGDLPLPDFLQFCGSCLAVRNDLINLRNKVQGSKAAAKIVAELQEQADGAWADPAADIQALVVGINTFLGLVEANFPADGSGYLLHYVFVGDGTAALEQRRLVSPGDNGQLNAIGGWLDTLIAIWV